MESYPKLSSNQFRRKKKISLKETQSGANKVCGALKKFSRHYQILLFSVLLIYMKFIFFIKIHYVFLKMYFTVSLFDKWSIVRKWKGLSHIIRFFTLNPFRLNGLVNLAVLDMSISQKGCLVNFIVFFFYQTLKFLCKLCWCLPDALNLVSSKGFNNNFGIDSF